MKIHLMLPVLMLFGLLPGCIANLSAQEITSDLERRIGQTLLNTIKGAPQKDPPSSERMEEFRNGARSKVGKSWGVNNRVKSSVDGKNITVMLSITLLPNGYVPAQKDAAAWRKVTVPGTRHSSGAEIGFVAGGSEVRRNKVFYRLKSGPILLRMNVTRKGNENAQQAIAKTTRSFSKFVKFAKEQKLLESEPSRIDLVYLPNDDTKEIVEDGSVVQAPYDGGKPIEMVFNVSAFSPLIDADKPFSIDVQLEPRESGQSAKFVNGYGQALPDTDSDGWGELAAEKDVPSELILKLGKFETKKSKGKSNSLEQFMVGRIRIRTSEDGETITLTFGIQRRSWHAIVQRFEIMGFDYEKTDQEFTTNRDVKYDLDGRMGFNDFVGQSGTLIQNYQQLLKEMASPRGEISANAPVCMSWQRDHYSGKAYEFLVAKDSREVKNRLPALGAKKRMNLVIDFKILQVPKRTSLNSKPAPDAGDLDLDDEPGNEEEEVNGLEEEIKLRRRISFEELTITLHPIEGKPKSMSPGEFLKQLPTSLRKMPQRNTSLWDYRTKGILDSRRLDVHFPLTNRYVDPETLNAEDRELAEKPKGIRMDEHRFAGTFELKLHAKLAMVGDSELRTVDAAIRYAVVPAGFKHQLIRWTTGRAWSIDGK